MNNKAFKNKKGFALVELMVACSIIVVATFALVSAGQKGIVLSERALRQTQASYLLEEGAEVMKIIRDGGWSSVSSLSSGTTYYLSYDNSTNTWSISTTANTIDSFFTRSIVLSDVKRDSNDDIASSGTTDSHIKKVTVTVTWNASTGSVSKDLSFYLVDIFS